MHFGLAIDQYQRFHKKLRRRQSIRHQCEFAIRWNKCDQLFILKLRQSNTLMEFYIFHFNVLPLSVVASLLPVNIPLSFNPNLKSGIPLKCDLILISQNLTIQHLAIGSNQHVDRLNHIQNASFFL